MKKTLKIMLAAVLSLAMLLTFAAAAEDTLTNAGSTDLISAADTDGNVKTHHDEHALDSFTDAPEYGNWKYQGLNCAVNNGTMNGHENKIRPDDSLTRAEMVTMMVRVLGAHATKAEIEHYVDVVADQWYYEAIQSGVAIKIINGSGNKMMPNAPITREQTFTILARTFLFSSKSDASADFVDNANVSAWAKSATDALIDAKVVLGDNTKTLRPQANVTRAEFAAMLDRIACLYVNTGASYSGKTVEGSIIVNDATADLTGAVIEGDLIITDAVGADNIDLSNVTVNGRIVIRGGEVNLNEGTSAAEVVVGNPTNASKVTASEGVTVEKITIAENSADVEIDVPAKEVVIDSSANEVTINKDAEEVTVNGSENTVKVPEGTKVDNVTVNGEASSITGNGNVGSATINGSDSKVETPNTNVTDNSPAKPSTTPSTGDDSGKADSSTGKPNSDPNASTNSGSLPGSSKPSTSGVTVGSDTYITYTVGESETQEKIFAEIFGGDLIEIKFNFNDVLDYNEMDLSLENYAAVNLGKLHVDADKNVAITSAGFGAATGFNTNVEIPLTDILQKMVDSTSTAVAGLIGIDTDEDGKVTNEEYNLLNLAIVLDEACMWYTTDVSEDQWMKSLFNERGIECSYDKIEGSEDAEYAIASFTGKIGSTPLKITMMIPVSDAVIPN